MIEAFRLTYATGATGDRTCDLWFLELGSQWASQLLAVDVGVRELIRMAGASAFDEEQTTACELFAAIRGLVAASREGLSGFDSLSQTLDETAGLSRELRKPFKKIQDGLRRVTDGLTVMEEWEREIDRSMLDCTGFVLPDAMGDGNGELAPT